MMFFFAVSSSPSLPLFQGSSFIESSSLAAMLLSLSADTISQINYILESQHRSNFDIPIVMHIAAGCSSSIGVQLGGFEFDALS